MGEACWICCAVASACSFSVEINCRLLPEARVGGAWSTGASWASFRSEGWALAAEPCYLRTGLEFYGQERIHLRGAEVADKVVSSRSTLWLSLSCRRISLKGRLKCSQAEDMA